MRTGAGRVVLLFVLAALTSRPVVAQDTGPTQARDRDEARAHAIGVLRDWRGISLSRIPSAHRASVDAAAGALSDPQTSQLQPYEPWYFWEYCELVGRERTPQRYVYLERQHLVIIPGQTSVRATVLDSNGVKLGQSILNTGGRSEAAEARLSGVYDYPSDRSHTVLEIVTSSGFGGDVRFYYGLLDNEFWLLRSEDDHGENFRDPTAWPNASCARGFAPTSVEECLKMLRDKDRVMHLRALAWLAGVHLSKDNLDPHTPGGEPYLHEDPKAAIVADACHASADIRAELERLAKDERDKWTRDAAQQALTPEFSEY